MTILADYKSKAVWNQNGDLQSLTLSTGEIIKPETTISSIFGLLHFLWKYHRTELTLWGKFCYWMNQ